ncbi:DUF1330 domain-containing protein [Acaryochloris marina NIES-2412]|uniref:DUF1330 domain-containing protein n=1 Tax=Acaryochloris marina TaxID=155978 RepID=UPI004059A598
MSVYFVIYQNIVDVARFTEYIHAVMPAIKRRGGRLIAQGTPAALERLVSYQRAVLFESRSVRCSANKSLERTVERCWCCI